MDSTDIYTFKYLFKLASDGDWAPGTLRLRLRILLALVWQPRCGIELRDEFNASQPLVSESLTTMCKAGLVTYTRAGKYRFYRLTNEGREQIKYMCAFFACLSEIEQKTAMRIAEHMTKESE